MKNISQLKTASTKTFTTVFLPQKLRVLRVLYMYPIWPLATGIVQSNRFFHLFLPLLPGAYHHTTYQGHQGTTGESSGGKEF